MIEPDRRSADGAVPFRERLRAQWWQNETNVPLGTVVRGALVGISAVYRLLTVVHRQAYLGGALRRASFPRPTISVGSIVAGGAGKTSLVVEMAQWLCDRSVRVAILSRGYGRSSKGPLLVSTGQGSMVSVAESGDEPQLLADLPGVCVAVGERREEAARVVLGACEIDVFLLDDGLQHHRAQREVDIVVLRGPRPFGNGRLLPYGPLREPMAALARAQAAVWIDPPEGGIVALTPEQQAAVPQSVLMARRRWIGLRHEDGASLPIERLAGAEVLVCCGVGAPDSVISAAEECGATIVDRLIAADHFAYREKDVVSLYARAISHGARAIVTTPKDWVKLGALVSRVDRPVGAPAWWIAEPGLCFPNDEFSPWMTQLLDLAGMDPAGGAE